MYQHIIWDFDGTLFNTYPVMASLFNEVLEGHGFHESEEHVSAHMRISMSHTIAYYKEKFGITDQIVNEYKQLRKEKELDLCLPYEGIEEICKYIADTGRKNYLYTHRGESAITFLKNHSLYAYFTDFVTARHAFERKPNPQAIQFLIEKHRMLPEETLMIGDRSIDIEAGKNAGIDSCYFAETDEKIMQTDYTIQHFSELKSIIDAS